MSKPEPKIVPVHLVKQHRHAGRDYKPGTPEKPTVLKLREDKAEWLVTEGVAEWPPANTSATGKSNPPPPAPTPSSPTKTKE